MRKFIQAILYSIIVFSILYTASSFEILELFGFFIQFEFQIFFSLVMGISATLLIPNNSKEKN